MIVQPVKIVPYNVFGGTLNPTLTLTLVINPFVTAVPPQTPVLE